eukprot:jgi/Astpho2/2257/Aster-x0517
MAEGGSKPGERHREEARDAAQSARQQLGKSQEAAEESLSRAGQSMRDQAAWAKAKAADAVERGQQAAEESISRAGQAARDHSTRARASGSGSLEQGQQAAEQRLNGIGTGAAEVGQEVNQRVNAASDTFSQVTSQATDAVNSRLQHASDALKTATAVTIDTSGQAYGRAQTFLQTGLAHYKQAETQVFEHLKEGVEQAMLHQGATLATLGGLALVALPGPRRFLWWQTFGRLRSEESMYLAAERKAQRLKETVAGQAAEAQKLQERLVAAESQMLAGLHKVRATSGELQSLSSRVGKTESKAQGLIRYLRDLPSTPALALRAEVATEAAAARRQQKALEKHIYRIMKRGI